MIYKNRNTNLKKRKNSRKKLWIYLVIALLVLALAAGAFWHFKKSDQNRTNIDSQKNDINFSPPTEEEQKAGDAVKPEVAQQQENDNQAPQPGKKAVVPTITYAGTYGDQVEVGGFIGTIFEEGGTCTLQLTKDTTTKTASVKAARGANSVDCPMLAIKLTDLSPGTWQAVLSYKSQAAEGKSEARPIEVQ